MTLFFKIENPEAVADDLAKIAKGLRVLAREFQHPFHTLQDYIGNGAAQRLEELATDINREDFFRDTVPSALPCQGCSTPSIARIVFPGGPTMQTSLDKMH